MKKKRIYIVATVLFIGILGCYIFYNIMGNTSNKQNNINFKNTIKSTSNRDRLPSATSGGISIGLYNTNGLLESSNLFNVNKNENLEKFISIGNMINEAMTYKLILLTDYTQSDFYADNKKVSDYTFELKPNQTVEVPVKLPILSKGFHDVLFVIVKYASVNTLNKEFRAATDMNHLLFVRFNVIVENSTKPTYKMSLPYVKNSNILNGVFINKNKDSLERWLVDEIKTDESFEYYLHIGNKYGKNDAQKYALILLDNWKQINIKGNDKVFFLNVNKGQEVRVDAEYIAGDNKGIHDLTPILIYNPYEEINVFNKDVTTAIRVGIEVK